jgi:hypothetical protein
MRNVKYFGLAILAAGVVSMGVFRAADTDPKYTIKEVMGKAHKGLKDPKDPKDPSLFAIVSDGKGTKEQKEMLLELYTALPANKPPKGDADKWKEKTKSIVDAAKEVVDGKDGGEKDLKKAVSCKDCHDAFKPK